MNERLARRQGMALNETEPGQPQHNGHQNGYRLNGHYPVLVLNQNYEPLHVSSVRRAIVLLLTGKAELLEAYEHELASAQARFPAPAVIRLIYLIRRPQPRVKLCRREVFARDHYTCQYCGTRTTDLTIDHVVPRSRGGSHTWENVVSACRACNHRKGGKSLAEARMRLLRQPFEPRPGRYYTIERALNARVHESWLKFLPELDIHHLSSR
ncbi:HNH endonuclease [Thermomicrobiaceae bacterium CFH 74404]|uniref:HNH endonuclease n=1 Tax=Thermalbibacter longus TaxID=2951981 RepID=A0AA42BA38_9BACT|nr:HNH endonuclease [Thermalbibacter longus]MCM8749401.1 HNH endonuclease [Thermalbibacter longus]